MDKVARSAEKLFNAGTEVFLPTVVTPSETLYRWNLPLQNTPLESIIWKSIFPESI